jgi:hypothetical protein
MTFEDLRRYVEADVAEEVGGRILEALEEGEDERAQVREVVGEAMRVEHVLLELAPELLDGVGPGGVGGERDELDREVEAPGPGAGLVGPGAGAGERERGACGSRAAIRPLNMQLPWGNTHEGGGRVAPVLHWRHGTVLRWMRVPAETAALPTSGRPEMLSPQGLPIATLTALPADGQPDNAPFLPPGDRPSTVDASTIALKVVSIRRTTCRATARRGPIP